MGCWLRGKWNPGLSACGAEVPAETTATWAHALGRSRAVCAVTGAFRGRFGMSSRLEE